MALVQIRRIDVGWKGEEVKVYDRLLASSKKQGLTVQALLKKIVGEA